MQKLKLNDYVDRMMIYNAFLLLRVKNDYNKEIDFRGYPPTNLMRYSKSALQFFNDRIPQGFKRMAGTQCDLCFRLVSGVPKIGRCVP